jgi:hypothetical protein
VYTYPGVATSNPFSSYYANPNAAGVSSTGGRTASFGTALYKNSAYGTATTTTGSTGLRGSVGGLNSSLGRNGGLSNSSSYYAPYVPLLDRAGSAPVTATSNLVARSDLQGILANSNRFSQPNGIQVRSDGQTVVLQGTVANAHEAQLAEAMLRLAPGVFDIRNELQFQGGP